MTDVEYEELIAHLRQQIADLTAERDRLKVESANASEALSASHETNSELSESNSDMRSALELLGVGERETEVTDDDIS